MRNSLSQASLPLVLLPLLALPAALSAQTDRASTSSLGGNAVVQPVKPTRAGIRGQVVYEDTGQPVVDGVVRLIDLKAPRQMGGMSTNERGNFGLIGLPAGEYYVTVQLGEEFAGRPTHGPLPNPTGDAAFDALRLEEFTRGFPKVSFDGSNSVRLDVRVPRRIGGTISGRVTGLDQKPKPNAGVNILRRTETGLSVVEFTRTADDGKYKVSRLPAGEYFVRAVPLEKNEVTQMDFARAPGVVYFSAAADAKDAVPVVVLPDHETGSIDISLDTHRLATVSGTLKMRSGMPLPGVMVRLSRGETDHIMNTDAEGHWSFKHVAGGKYSLVIGTTGAVPPHSEYEKLPAFIHKTQQLEVGEQDLENVELVVSPGGIVSGTVIVEGDMPKPRAIILTAIGNPSEGQTSAQVQVKTDGTFTLKGVPIGDVRLLVSAIPMKTYTVKSISWNGTDLTKEKLSIIDDSDIRNVVVVLVPIVTPKP